MSKEQSHTGARTGPPAVPLSAKEHRGPGNLGERDPGAVLVTGCSSGIGRASALELARKGYRVFATVRSEHARDSLLAEGVSGLFPLCPLDLTHPEHFPVITRQIREQLESLGIQGLRAVVNNAGGGFIGPVETMDPDRLRAELDTRVVGPVRLLQTLLPLLRIGHGRIIWISTPGLIPVPYVSSIHVGEFAARCLAQTLSIELADWGIPSIVVACGGIDTPAAARSERELAAEMESWPDEWRALYAGAMKRLMSRLHRFDTTRAPVERVALAVQRAVEERRPRSLYRVGSGALAMAVLKLLPEAFVLRALRRVL